VLVASGKINLVKLNMYIEVMNAMFLPIVLGFLYVLARYALPEEYRLKNKYAVVVGVILFLTAACGLLTGTVGFLL